MNNAIKYGTLIGLLGGFWIILMHKVGLYDTATSGPQGIHWMEFLSVLIPFGGLYFGIRRYRKTHFNDRMSLFQGMMQGFKIILIGGLLYTATLSIYLRFTRSSGLAIDYMQRLVAIGIVGILLVLVVSLLLMTRPRNL